MDDRDKRIDQNSTAGVEGGKDLSYYLPPGQPPLTEEEIAAGIEFSPLTGLPGFKARPGEPMLTHAEVRKIYEEEFP